MSTSQTDGYLAVPPAGSGEPVLVLHAWWGLNDTIRTFCDRLADAGFLAFAPDLYHGQMTDQIAEAERLAMALDDKVEQTRDQIDAALRYVLEKSGESDSHLAVIGFSLGAFYALDLSARAPEQVQSVVVYYGAGPADFSRAKARYLGHFAANDPYEPVENVDWLQNEIEQAGHPVTFYRYPDTGHWFCEPDRSDAYNQPAAHLAWERTLAFLRQGVVSA